MLRRAVAERQDFQKFLKIQVIQGINPNFNLLSPVSVLEHFFFYLKKIGEINHRTPVVLSLFHRVQSCARGLAVLNTATGSRTSTCFLVS